MVLPDSIELPTSPLPRNFYIYIKLKKSIKTIGYKYIFFVLFVCVYRICYYLCTKYLYLRVLQSSIKNEDHFRLIHSLISLKQVG